MISIKLPIIFLTELQQIILKFIWNHNFFFFFFPFIFISWRLITSQHFSGFCHTLTWISHEVTCIPHSNPPSPPSPPDSSGSSQCTRPEHLSHASPGCWCKNSMYIIYRNHKILRIAKAIMRGKKDQAGGRTLSDCRQNYQGTVVKTCGIGSKTDILINRTEERAQK